MLGADDDRCAGLVTLELRLPDISTKTRALRGEMYRRCSYVVLVVTML